MTPIHPVTFQRFADVIATKRRTLFHVPIDHKTWAIGDNLCLRNAALQDMRTRGVVTDVRQVRLIAELDTDLGKLCTDRDAYLASWNTHHPELPAADDPVVWRIEFRYGAWAVDPTDPPEWSLAS